MTNLEKYKEEIINIFKTYFEADLAVKNNRPINCKFISCEECDLSSKYGESCKINTINWLAQEVRKN